MFILSAAVFAGIHVLRGTTFLTSARSDGKNLSVRVAFEFELRDSKKETTVWSHSYSHDQPVDGKDVSAVVAALNRDVQSGLGEVMASLNQYFSAHAAIVSTGVPVAESTRER